MGSFSDYLENELLDHVFKVGAFAQPTNLYVGLCKSTIADDDTGSTLPGEFSGGAYARKKCNTWDTASAGATENTNPVTFVEATTNLGTATHFAVCDKTTLGNVIGHGALGTAKKIDKGDTPRFATGEIDVTLD